MRNFTRQIFLQNASQGLRPIKSIQPVFLESSFELF